MSFTSWQYALFLPAVVLLYWRLALRGRMVLLLVASYIFYGAWDARFLALLLTSTAIDFYCGLAIAGERRSTRKVFAVACLPVAWLAGYPVLQRLVPQLTAAPVDGAILGTAALFPVIFTALYAALWRLPEARQRKSFLLLSILTNLGVLGFFKYFNFFGKSALALCAQFGFDPGWTLPHIILPVAISFYTFQSIAYAVDIYRAKAQPARDVLTFAAYLSFFPQLIAGPIERPNDLLPQFTKAAVWNISDFHRGLRLILIGLFKKIFVGDNCALLANYAFDPKTPLSAPWAILGVVAFAFQIYGDFSGYTDIARGSARLLGIHLNWNFKFPYFARGPSDFWQRWHITLSVWFRDYVYIPLGGNRGGTARTLFNLWITMLLAGLWHGSSWIFVLWGAYHGALLILYRLVPGLNWLAESAEGPRWRVPLGMTLMFTFTLVGWAIFRCQNLTQLGAWFAAFASWSGTGAVNWLKPALWLLLHTAPLLLLQWLTWKARDEIELTHIPWAMRGFIYTVLFLGIATSAATDVEFIYFQF